MTAVSVWRSQSYDVGPMSRFRMTLVGVEETDTRRNVAPMPSIKPQSELSTHCVVGGAHAFILRISSFFGLAPLRFDSRQNGFSVSISGAMCVYSFILVTFLMISTIVGLVAEINVGVKHSVRMSSRMSQVVSACDVLVVVLSASVGVYGAPARLRKMMKFMNRVALVDNSIGGHYSALTERKLCASLLAILIFFTILIIDDFFFYVFQAKKIGRHWEVVINYVGFYILWYVVMILELQFAFTALSVNARFRALNDTLDLTGKNLTVPLERSRKTSALNIFAIQVSPGDVQHAEDISLLVDTMPKKQTVNAIVRRSVHGEPLLVASPGDAIHGIASLHGTLCEIVHRIDECYSIPLVVILISTLLHLIVTPYFLIMEIMISYTHRVHFLVLQFLWCATHMLRMFVVVEPSHYTIEENKRTESLVCRLMSMAPTPGALATKLELFSRQLMLRSPGYSPMGMCTLDRPLVASILGAVTTYLVIVIQFQRYDV